MNRENLEYLRDVVIPYMEANPTSVDLNNYEADGECGTCRCLAGWYVALKYHMSFYDWVGEKEFEDLDDEYDNPHSPSDLLDLEFDLDTFHAQRLFDTAREAGVLEDRKKVLEELLK
jgi:hypothetical protein